MRLTGMVSMVGAATLAVAVFLHFPIPSYQPIQPPKPSGRLPRLADISADSPEPPPPTAQQIAKLRSVFGGMCRTSVRSEMERRRLDHPKERVNALCDCLVGNMIENRGKFDGREGFENFGLIAGQDTASERRALDDARYRAVIDTAERACAAR